MRLLFKQRLFSWFDSYDIYYEDGSVAYTVQGKLSWGHKLMIYDVNGNEVGMVLQKMLTLLPKFEIYERGNFIGSLNKEFSVIHPRYNIDYNGWHVEGSWTEWDYTITDHSNRTVAVIGKELFHFTDTYTIDVTDPKDALYALMFVLAIDAEKCSRSKG